jgi:Tol biopolymer transport system component
MLTRCTRIARLAGLLLLSVAVLVSCQNNPATTRGQELVLCGRTNDSVIRVYHVSISQAGTATLKQVIALPGSDLSGAGSCPRWLTGSKLAWLYGNTTNGYQRDVYLLDLNNGQVRPWFHLSGNDDIEDVILASGSPWALIVSSRDQAEGCSQHNSAELHWTCLYARGDLYAVDEQGEVSRLTHYQAPLCQATWRSGGHTVAFRQAKGCVGPAPGEPSRILFVDIETKQIRSFSGGQDASTPLWSPDGKHLAFFNRLGSPYVLDLGNDQVVPLDDDVSGLYSHIPAWSPDGQRLAWVTMPASAAKDNAWRARVNVFDLVRHAKTGFPESENPRGAAFIPQWSPDGKQLAWAVDSTFYFGSIQSSKMYTAPAGVTRVLDWSFDGQAVAYIGSASPQSSSRVFVMSRNGNDIFGLTDRLSLEDIRWLQVRWVR